jgi:hypothetical protein
MALFGTLLERLACIHSGHVKCVWNRRLLSLAALLSQSDTLSLFARSKLDLLEQLTWHYLYSQPLFLSKAIFGPNLITLGKNCGYLKIKLKEMWIISVLALS